MSLLCAQISPILPFVPFRKEEQRDVCRQAGQSTREIQSSRNKQTKEALATYSDLIAEQYSSFQTFFFRKISG